MKAFAAAAQRSVLPGFGLTMGFTLLYLSLIVLIPLSTLLLKTMSLSWARFGEIMMSPRTVAAFKISFQTAFAAAVVDLIFGSIVGWVLVRYRFAGRQLMDALVDLPFALPTAVAGIVLTTLFSPNGWLGRYLIPHGIEVNYTPLGITIALAFIGLPFVVRTIQPILSEMDPSSEDAAATIGANRRHILARVIFPKIWPAMVTGFTLAFARGLGEYGSIVFISGNIPLKTEITTILIVGRLENYDYAGATALAFSMLVLSFLLLFLINFLQARSRKRIEAFG
ncbi:sulfate ABC transporter permease subunit CysT [bacterium]|nr:sulfate ABC transporter permease subunit CysT [bacterium]MCI0604490.1 sulfate ABC transporter permease subunit CysT [bacterium]